MSEHTHSEQSDSEVWSASGAHADEEVVIYHVMQRDRTPVRDRLTPRMEARRIIDALDAARAARGTRS